MIFDQDADLMLLGLYGQRDPVDLGCFGGVQSSGSSGSGNGASWQNSDTIPSNLQNPSFQALAPGTSNLLSGISQGYDSGNPNFSNVSPTSVNGIASNSLANPLVAPVTGAQNTTLNSIGTLLGQQPNTLSGAFGLVNSELAPGYASGLAGSPQTVAAEQAAIQPIQQQYNTQTVPGLEGSFTQAGQRVGGVGGQGSSAFDTAIANAQGNERATEAATTGAIANNAYQTGLNISANAPGQMASLNSSDLNNLISGLNAQALPQLTSQYGISAGSTLYNQQMAILMQALGLQVQGEQPAIGYWGNSQGASSEYSHNQSSSSGFNANPFGTAGIGTLASVFGG